MSAKHKRPLALLIGLPLALALLLAFAFIQRDALRQWAFNVTGEESLPGQARGLVQLGITLMRPAPRTEPFEQPVDYAGVSPFGINTFLHNEVEAWKREEQVRLIAEAGFDWIREEFPWEDIEIHGRGDFIDRRNDPNGTDAWAKYDEIVDLAQAYDLDLIIRISNPPEWAHAGAADAALPGPPADYDDFARFAGIMAERYRGRVQFYQLWNEPNIYPEWGEKPVDPAGYTDLLCRAYAAIKAADPHAVVIAGALSSTAELSGRDYNDFLYLEAMYEAGAAGCFDVMAVQGYGLWSGPTDHRMRPVVINFGRNQYIRDIMLRHGDGHKAIWISEMNWNAAPDDIAAPFGRVTLEEQAAYAPLAYLRAEREWPWIGVMNFWYFKRADPSWLAERRPEAYFQMSDPDFNLQPVYYSMQEYIREARVMYQGWHWADHWAVEYGQGWGPGPGEPLSMAASEGAETATLRFEGARFSLVINGDSQPEARLRMRIDGGAWIAYDPAAGPTLTWRGRNGLHEVEIEPQGEIVIHSYIVREPGIDWQPLLNASLVLLVIGGYLSFMRARGQAATERAAAPKEDRQVHPDSE